MLKLHCHSTHYPGSIAPLVTISLHACVFSVLIWKTPRLYDLEEATCYTFWYGLGRTITALTAFLYLAVCYQNPGLIKDYVRPLSGSAREISITQKLASGPSSTGSTTAPQQTISTKLQTIVDTGPLTVSQKPSYQQLQEGSIDIQESAVPTPSLSIEKTSTDEALKGIEMVKIKAAEEPVPIPVEELITVEARFCTACEMLQPLRAKHCRACNSCVALHDHHCPWLGTCIGEKNRLIFYWYLVAQAGLLYYALFLVLSE